MSGALDPTAARGGEKCAERGLRDAKRDRLQVRRAKRVAQRTAQMAGADWLDIGDDAGGKGKARLGVGGAERSQRVEMVNEAAASALRRKRAVDRQFGLEA